MFSEAYIIFSLGLTKPLQTAMFPTCFKTHDDCKETITHVQNYIQIVGIIVGGWLSSSSSSRSAGRIQRGVNRNCICSSSSC